MVCHENENEATPIDFSIAARTGTRMKGLLHKAPDTKTLMLVPCSDVHTFGMKYDLDIAFVASDGAVLDVYLHVPPNKRLTCKAAATVLERFSGNSHRWVQPGDRLVLTVVPKNNERKIS